MYISLISVILVLLCSVLILNPSTELLTQTEVDMRCKDTGYYLTAFICGTTAENGAKEFVMNVTEYKDLPITVVDDFSTEHPVMYPSWSFNASIPEPTIRVTEGDTVRITLINPEGNKHPHTIHFHSTHDGINDGTFLSGPSGSVMPGTNYTYEFVAGPAGVYPYHCHIPN
jgi:manganese oxidase